MAQGVPPAAVDADRVAPAVRDVDPVVPVAALGVPVGLADVDLAALAVQAAGPADPVVGLGVPVAAVAEDSAEAVAVALHLRRSASSPAKASTASWLDAVNSNPRTSLNIWQAFPLRHQTPKR